MLRERNSGVVGGVAVVASWCFHVKRQVDDGISVIFPVVCLDGGKRTCLNMRVS